MAIEELLRVVAPPAQPREPGDAARWAQIQELLGDWERSDDGLPPAGR